VPKCWFGQSKKGERNAAALVNRESKTDLPMGQVLRGGPVARKRNGTDLKCRKERRAQEREGHSYGRGQKEYVRSGVKIRNIVIRSRTKIRLSLGQI